MGLLTRKDLLTRGELKKEKVDLGDGNYVFVREMTGRERDNFEQSLFKQVKRGNKVEFEQRLENFRSKLAVNTLCDENGDMLLEPKDIEKFAAAIGADNLEKIVEAAQRLNKISEKDKDELSKN